MSELSWKDVREGDKVKVKHDQGAVIEGVYEGDPISDISGISGLTMDKTALTIIKHTPAFKNGDIGVITSHSTGSNFVGIYVNGTFNSSDSSYHTKIHSPTADDGFTIKIVGNVNEQ